MAHCTAAAPSGLNASVMSLAISGGGPGWLLRAAIALATACAAASAACLAWYSARPCLSSSDHDCTCAIWAAWTRWGFLVCCITELRSKALSWVTATATERWAGGSNRGKITVTRIATHTSTARNSGSNPYCAPSLDSPYPWGGFRRGARLGALAGQVRFRRLGMVAEDRRSDRDCGTHREAGEGRLVDDGDRRAQRLQRVVDALPRDVERRHDGVAGELVDDSVAALDLLGRPSLQG